MVQVFTPKDPETGLRRDLIPILDYYDPTENHARHLWKKAFMGVIGQRRLERSNNNFSIADIVPKLRAMEILRAFGKYDLLRKVVSGEIPFWCVTNYGTLSSDAGIS